MKKPGSFIVYPTDQDATVHLYIEALETRVRESEAAVKSLVDAHYGMSYHHIGDSDGMTKAEADVVRAIVLGHPEAEEGT